MPFPAFIPSRLPTFLKLNDFTLNHSHLSPRSLYSDHKTANLNLCFIASFTIILLFPVIIPKCSFSVLRSSCLASWIIITISQSTIYIHHFVISTHLSPFAFISIFRDLAMITSRFFTIASHFPHFRLLGFTRVAFLALFHVYFPSLLSSPLSGSYCERVVDVRRNSFYLPDLCVYPWKDFSTELNRTRRSARVSEKQEHRPRRLIGL